MVLVIDLPVGFTFEKRDSPSSSPLNSSVSLQNVPRSFPHSVTFSISSLKGKSGHFSEKAMKALSSQPPAVRRRVGPRFPLHFSIHSTGAFGRSKNVKRSGDYHDSGYSVLLDS